MNGFHKPTPGGDPVYTQIIRQFIALVLQGRINNGDAVPSRRTVAMQMGVNPMTVQKAFAGLEGMGLIHTPPNSKSVVRADEAVLARLREEMLAREVTALAKTAVAVGVGCGALVEMVEKEYGRLQV